MKVVFLTGGAREMALRFLLENGINVSALICPKPSKKNSRFAQAILTAHEFGVEVICVGKNEVTSTLKALEYDVLLSCGFSYILDYEAIATAKTMALNVHPTLLPKYRGYRSGPYIVMNGEKKSGVTIHELVGEMDKGDILKQESFEVTQFDTTKSVFRKARELEPSLILEVLEDLQKERLSRQVQDESEATEYNTIRKPDDSLIDIEKPFKELYNFIRACDYNDYPAHFYVDGEKVLIKLTRENKPEGEDDLI